MASDHNSSVNRTFEARAAVYNRESDWVTSKMLIDSAVANAHL
jgi:hypothetical protein